jgi:hypothetical protein
MANYAARLGVSNSRDKPQIVAVEPWADDYTLLPGEELEIVASGHGKVPWFHVVEWDGTSQVYCEETDDFKVVQNGVELKCGRNRQPNGPGQRGVQ